MKGKLAVITIAAAMMLPGSASAQTFPSHLLKRIHHQRVMTHYYQGLMSVPKTPYHFWAERHCKNKACRYSVWTNWYHKHFRAKHRYELWKQLNPIGVPAAIYNTFVCIHPFEEPSWSTAAGGLGFTSPPDTYNVAGTDALAARYGNSWYSWSKAAQIAFAYDLKKVYGYKPWSTAYHCV